MEHPVEKLTVLDQIAAKDKVRRKILDAAGLLYARKGYAATSIEEISEAAGVSLPVTHHYVKNKSEIMRLIMEDLLTIFQESLLREIGEIADPERKLLVAVRLYFQVVDSHREKVLLIYQKSSSLDKPSRGKVMQLELDVSTIFRLIIEEGMERGVFRQVDTDLMALNIVMLAHMWVLKGWHLRSRFTLDQYAALQTETVLRALRI